MQRVLAVAFTACRVASSFMGCQDPVRLDEGTTPPFDVDAIVRSVGSRSHSEVRPAGVLSPERSINEPVLWPAQRSPAVTTDGTNFLVVAGAYGSSAALASRT